MFEKYSERRSDPDFCDEEVQELGIPVVGCVCRRGVTETFEAKVSNKS